MISAKTFLILTAGMAAIVVTGCHDNADDVNKRSDNSTFNTNYSNNPNDNDQTGLPAGTGGTDNSAVQQESK